MSERFIWEDNRIVRERLVNKTRPLTVNTTVPLENGHPAPVKLFLPPGLNISDTSVKYPMVFYVYSGPNTNTVFDTFTVGKYWEDTIFRARKMKICHSALFIIT